MSIDDALHRQVRITPKIRRAAGLLAVYVAFGLLIDHDLWRPRPVLLPEENPAVAEAKAWLAGRVHLDPPNDTEYERPWDTALFDGHVYNVFPPLLTIISTVALAADIGGLPLFVLMLWLFALLPALAYGLFLRRTDNVFAAVLLSIGLLLGTSLHPLLSQGIRNGSVWQLNHVLSVVGLLIFLVDYFVTKRIWLGGLGLIIAVWTRQLTVIYLLPLGMLAWQSDAPLRRKRIVQWLSIAVVIAALPMTLQALKFGNPFDSGYRHLYAGRTDEIAQDAADGLFALRFVPRNLYYMNVGLPEPNPRTGYAQPRPNPMGTGIWWTTPLLLWLMVDARKWWQSRDSRWLIAAAAMIFIALMVYHTTGRAQKGFNRFSMDFVPVLFAVIAPSINTPRKRWIAAACVAWSVYYFCFWL